MARKSPKSKLARLDALIDDALVDCYSEDEVQSSLVNMAAEGIVCPFTARVIGEEVEVVEVRVRECGYGVDAVCRYKGKLYNVDIHSLEWPKKKPTGYEYVEAYFYHEGYPV